MEELKRGNKEEDREVLKDELYNAATKKKIERC